MNIKNTTYQKELNIAIGLTEKASEIILNYYDKPLNTRDKSDNSPVTDADIASSEFILNALSKEFPNDTIISEENIPEKLKSAERIWYIDPLDGTKDFINKNDEFTVLISLCVANRPVIGVLGVPITKEIACAEKGQGAYLIDSKGKTSPMKVSTRNSQKDMVIVHSRYHQTEELKKFLKDFGDVKSYPCGSAGMKCLHVAKGLADLYHHPYPGLKAWDTAATSLIVEEAGGVSVSGNGVNIIWSPEELYHKNGVIIGTPFCHKLALDLI